MRPTFRTVQSARARMIAALFGGFIAACAHSAQQDAAQGFPAKPIRFIVPFTAGPGTDITARAIAAKLSDILGQQTVVDNRPGAAGSIGVDLTANAKSVMELIGYAKANPGRLNYGSSGTGGLSHFAGAMFAHMSNTVLVHIPYRGGAAALGKAA